MNHEAPNNLLIEASKEDFSTWINRPFIPNELKAQLHRANVLIVPREGFRGRVEPVFPVGTEELFQFLKEYSDKGLNVDLCIADADYRELALHGAVIIVGVFIVTSVIFPVLVILISDYIEKRFGLKEGKSKIKVEMTVIESDGRVSRMLYEGSAKDFKKTVKPSLESISGMKSNDQKKLQE